MNVDRLALVFLWIGVVSFGGGLTTVPEMHRELVDVHHWLTAREFADGYAIGQLAPGPNMLSVVFFGYKVAGVVGGLVAVAATVSPGAIASALLGRAWVRYATNRWVGHLRRGLVPVGGGLMTAGVFVLAKTTLASWPLLVLAACVALATYKKWVNTAVAVIAAGVVAGALGL